MKEITKEIYKDWPDPFPMMFESFAQYPYQSVPALYVPSLLGIMQTMMQRSFVTTRRRNVNTNDDVISKTGGGKDDNSVEPLVKIAKEIRTLLGANTSEAAYANLLNVLSPMNTSVTGITQFMEIAEPRHAQFKGVFLLDTEGENHFQNIGQNGQAAVHSRALVDVEIDAFNGNMIKGRNTKGSTIEPIENPNMSFVRMIQNDPYFNSLSGWMNTKGYIPRKGVWFDSENRKEIPSTMLNQHVPKPSKDFLDFIIYAAKWFYQRSTNEPIWVVSCLAGGEISNYEIDVIYGEKQKELLGDEFKAVKRAAMLAEKYCTLIAGWHWCWLDYIREKKGIGEVYNPMSTFTNEELVLPCIFGSEYEPAIVPLINMFVENKIHLLKQLGDNLEDKMYEFIDLCYKKVLNSVQEKYLAWTSVGLAPRELLSKKCREDKDLKILIEELKKKNLSWDDKLNRWIDKNGYTVVPIPKDGHSFPCVVPRALGREIENG